MVQQKTPPAEKQAPRDDVLGIEDIQSDVTDAWSSEPYQPGFTAKVVLGAFFIALIMLPGLIYMGLMAGTSIGSGAEWVTVLLFLEIARRSYTKLKRQELIIIHYMCSSLTGAMGGVMLAGGIFAGLIWNQYLKRSDAFRNFNLTDQMPAWFSPSLEALKTHTFLTAAWLPAIIVAILGFILYRMQFFGIGYLAFRFTADVEKLPFPLARIGAEGATALAESDEEHGTTWRWPIFSLLGVIGVVWGLIYLGIPALSTALFGTRVTLIPIPFLDLTTRTENILPSAAMAIGFDIGLILLAFVIPWRVVVGGAITCLICQVILPPFLYQWGILTQWQHGFGALDTQLANSLDLWMSVGIGGALSIAITGIYLAIRATRRTQQGKRIGYDWAALFNPPEGRGDYSVWLAIALYVISGIGFILLVHGLINLGWLGGFPKPRSEWFPVWILCTFAFLWTPINTYIHARLAGIAGQQVSIPFIREGAFFLSHYKYPDAWLAPMPINDFGYAATLYKQFELTRVKFTALFKVELLTFVVLTLAGFFYWSYLWGLGNIPSDQYPYAQQMWPFFAKGSALWTSALGEGNNQILAALKLPVILGAMGVFLVLFSICNIFSIPLAYYFGAVGGIGQFPYVAITLLIGLAVRFYVSRRVGAENLKRYAPVMLVGFSAGFGIAGMMVVAIVLIKSAISSLLY